MDISLEPPLEKTFGVINLPNKDPSVIAALLSFVYKDTYSHDLCRTVHASSYQSDLGANVESTAHLGSPKEIDEQGNGSAILVKKESTPTKDQEDQKPYEPITYPAMMWATTVEYSIPDLAKFAAVFLDPAIASSCTSDDVCGAIRALYDHVPPKYVNVRRIKCGSAAENIKDLVKTPAYKAVIQHAPAFLERLTDRDAAL